MFVLDLKTLKDKKFELIASHRTANKCVSHLSTINYLAHPSWRFMGEPMVYQSNISETTGSIELETP